MRITARRNGHVGSSVEERSVVDGHVVERLEAGRPGAELHYRVRARDGRTATLIASIRPYGSRDERARFRALARKRVELTHPAAIRVRSFGEHAGQPHLIADPYPDSTFAGILESESPMASERAIAMLSPVADGLDHAHARGLVHEALDGAALLVTEDGRLLLDAFGVVAGHDDVGWGFVRTGDVRYRSPEQVRAEPIGPAANVYSLTGLLVHALTGAPPYSGDSVGVTYSQLVDAPPRVSKRMPELPRAFDKVVARGMAKDPSERFDSARELMAAAAEALGVKLPEPVTAPPVELEPRRLRNGRAARAHAHSNGSAATGSRPVAHARRPAVQAAAMVALAAVLGVLAAAVLDPFGDDAPAEPAATERPAAQRAWQELAGVRTELRDELASATTPQDQAAAATELADAYGAAADAGAGGSRSAAARDAATAYEELAAAAEANDEDAFAAASESVDEAELGVTGSWRAINLQNDRR